MRIVAYKSEAKKIRNRLSHYKKNSVLKGVLKYLHSPPKDNIEAGQKVPWVCFLLIEWLYQVQEKVDAKEAKDKDIFVIINKIWLLQSKAVNLSNPSNTELQLRAMLISQLGLQTHQSVHFWQLCRFFYLITQNQLPPEYASSFQDHTGVRLEDFFTLSLWLLSLMTIKKTAGIVRFDEIVTTLMPYYDSQIISNFFLNFSLKTTELEIFFAPRRDQSTNPDAYLTESPLYKKPLILFDDVISTPHNSLASKAISRFVYETIKSNGLTNFKKYYEKKFEQYIQDLTRMAFGKIIPEEEIKSLYTTNGITGKVVDCILNCNGKTLFIESKGVEPHPRIMAFTNPERLKERVGRTFWVGVTQAYACSQLIEEHDLTQIEERQNRYAVIVTNSSFYMYSGSWISDNISPKLFGSLTNKYQQQINPENVLIVSLEEYERIVSACTKAKTTIADFIDFCKDQDFNPETRKFEVGQHILEFNKTMNNNSVNPIGSDLLLEYKDKLFSRLEECLRSNHNHWVKNGLSAYPQYATSYNRLRIELGIPPNKNLIKFNRWLTQNHTT